MKGKSSTTAPKKLNLSGVIGEARKPAFFLIGMFAASQLGKLVDRNVTPAVKGIFGLDGVGPYVKPAILIGTGLVGAKLVKNEDIKMGFHGVTATGGIILVKNLLNVDLIPLSGLDGGEPIPGLGQPSLPELEAGVPPVQVTGAVEEFTDGLGGSEENGTPIA